MPFTSLSSDTHLALFGPGYPKATNEQTIAFLEDLCVKASAVIENAHQAISKTLTPKSE